MTITHAWSGNISLVCGDPAGKRAVQIVERFLSLNGHQSARRVNRDGQVEYHVMACDCGE